MKTHFSEFARVSIPVFLFLMVETAAVLPAHSQIIPTNVTINWTPGVTVGLRGGAVPVRTNLINVTQAPYNADNTGTVDASAAINAAIAAATSNQVVYFPNGTYILSNSVFFTKNYITLRGQSTNAILIGVGSSSALLKAGNDSQGNNVYTISSGANKGSQVVVLSSPPGPYAGVGDEMCITETTTTIGSAAWPVISTHQYDCSIEHILVITNISGNTITLSAPLCFDFTNAPVASDFNVHSTIGVGIENLTISDKNAVTGQVGNYAFLVYFSMCHDCWMTNCSIVYPQNYGMYISCSAHIWMAHNQIRHALSVGPNHSGLLMEYSGECLIEDNIISDGLEPGIEFGTGFSGNAVFANFFTNNYAFDILCHNTHPVMNLWEENVCSQYFEMDGYFGSQSHQTLFRNAIESTSIPLMLKRWVSYMNVVGNVLGTAGGNYGSYSATNNNPSAGMIIEFGYPNIGNNGYNGTFTPPLAWNYPGANYLDANGNLQANGTWTFTNTQVNTTTLIGVFTNIPAPIAGVYSLVFQDNINTNLYYPTNGSPVWPAAAGTSSNLLISTPITVSNGWRVFVSGQSGYQQLQLSQGTHLITGNYDYYNKAVMWNSNGAQTIPVSLLYTNGAPSYWGTNSWPAVDPTAAKMLTMIPAQEKYLGIAVNSTNPVLAAPTGLHIVAP